MSIDKRNQQELYNAFINADTLIQKKYVAKLDSLPVIDCSEAISKLQIGDNVQLYQINKIVYDKDESVLDKLTTVYMALTADTNAALILLLNGTETGVNLYIGVADRNITESGKVFDNNQIKKYGNILEGVLKGNFPGTELSKRFTEKQDDIPNDENNSDIITRCFNGCNTIVSVSSIPSLRNENELKNHEFVQGLEKLVDSMRGKTYTAMFIADVVGNSQAESLCAAYEDIYSQLSPFKQSTFTYNENTSSTDTESFVKGVVNTTNKSTAKAHTEGTSSSVTRTHGGGVSVGVNGGIGIKGIAHIGASITGNYNYSKAKMVGENESNTDTVSEGTAESLTEQNSVANALTKGSGESLQITYDNRAVKSLLERIDEQIVRVRECEDFGLFSAAAYFTAPRQEDAVAAASAYKSIMRGENSSVESSAMNVWEDCEPIEIDENTISVNTLKHNGFTNILNYLKRFYHPTFALPSNRDRIENVDAEDKLNESDFYFPVTPALLISGRELALQFALPKKSIIGVPVLKCAEFGRNVIATDRNYIGNLNIGKIYHMHQVESTDVKLSLKEMTAHTFITGSTGSGKSNAIYQLLSKMCTQKNKVHFMVIEPAKGEYKDIFGTEKNLNVKVYGTNPRWTHLLRINPFRFPQSTHIYEHMDRLVELFNVCWPMYAAMPAVLKAALERAYISAGWDLERSENITGYNIYPTFASLATEIRKYVDKSEYSDENKSNYKGSLLTRVESLTNGINGMIFTANDLSDEELFDNNVIVDLSKVGSTETKSLIMGIMVMKLQEYRSASLQKNVPLKHITVLEEAHHLLKRTSSEQSAESSNLVGKSVEMLANSIAEMRTYGEAFIIADQSPGLMDMSVIRNTNTKIILRLPEKSDRELVGKAASLNDEQIEELARLKTGVAAVYQNNWITPVLCQFERFSSKDEIYLNPDTNEKDLYGLTEALNVLMKGELRKKLDNIEYSMRLVKTIATSDLPNEFKVSFITAVKKGNKMRKVSELAKIAYSFFNAEDSLSELRIDDSVETWKHQLIMTLKPSIVEYTENEINNMLTMLIHEHYLTHKTYEPIYVKYMDAIERGC